MTSANQVRKQLYQKPVISRNEVQGSLGCVPSDMAQPDRRFHILDNSRPDEDRAWEVDVYETRKDDGTLVQCMITLLCPLCERHLNIKSERKQILIDEERGHLSVEPFRCSWEGDFGEVCCNFQAAIEPPPRGDSDKNFFRLPNGTKLQLGGIFKRV